MTIVKSRRLRDERRRAFKRAEKALAGKRPPSTTVAISVRMGQVRHQGTSAELAVRQMARLVGLRFTVKNRDLPGSPDLANRLRRVAVFVHGCFWHRHRNCTRTTTPKSNRSFWEAKFRRNQERDRAAIRLLRKRGFATAVVWECEIGRTDRIVRRLVRLIDRAAAFS